MSKVVLIITLILRIPLDALADSPIRPAPIPDWQEQWSYCSKDSDCKIIYRGCYFLLGVNQRYEEEAQELLWKSYGEPKTLNCAPGMGVYSYLDPKPYCQKGTCKP